MGIEFGREICGELPSAAAREWLVTNGIGGFACGTVAGLLTRRYHGLLVAALTPPLGRTLMLTGLDGVAHYDGGLYALSTNRWANGSINPQGYQLLEHFCLEGTLPVWRFALADAQLEQRLWMQPGQNTTYICYRLLRGTFPLQLNLKALVNYRDYHGNTRVALDNPWLMAVDVLKAGGEVPRGVQIVAYPGATPLYLFSDGAIAEPAHTWYLNFDLAVERYRGLSDQEDHLHAATFTTVLEPDQSLTLVASTEPAPNLDAALALQQQQRHERQLLQRWEARQPNSPAWVQQLVLAADQFIVERTVISRTPGQEPGVREAADREPTGKTIIAGYPWFSDWGRDTMISLPGLTLTTGRPEIARSILSTYARYINQGMVPNRFPDRDEPPEYNTIDATLWYVQALAAYVAATDDLGLVQELWPVLLEIVDWHCRGTRYQIRCDPADGLLSGGATGSQLTWMDAKVGDWVVTPRIGKPVEVNALWYNALRALAEFARQLGHPTEMLASMATQAQTSFQRFWNPERGYCYDVLDSPTGNDPALRPNQIFAVSLPHSPLTGKQQQAVVDSCGRYLLTSHGLRSLAANDPQYQGRYGGNPRQRDGAYHQGTVWGWLLGPFVIAHLRVYQDPVLVRQFLKPMADQLWSHGLGSLSEIFDGDPPFRPRGCFAQAWTVAETLRAWVAAEPQ